MNKFLTILIILITLVSCENKNKTQIDISGINSNAELVRFDQEFYGATATTLPNLKEKYPFLFPVQTADSIWLARINDPHERELFNKSQNIFGDFSTEKETIDDLFKHVKFYYPTFKEPQIYTIITNLDFENKVMFAQNYLFVSLDMFLGTNDEVYNSFPVYLSQNFEKSHLYVDIGKAIGEAFVKRTNDRQFIDIIISEGKKMYQLDCFIPTIPDNKKMGYSLEKMKWVEENETQIWTYFMERKMLYSTDPDLNSRFVADAPFSKFYIDIDKESPGKIGVWLGWQIVRSYMNNNNVTLQQLMQTNAEEIFKKSKYKPKK